MTEIGTPAAQISPHLVRIVDAFIGSPDRWFSARDIEQLADVSPRTSRHHLTQLAHIGLIECRVVYPGNRYRLAPKPDQDFLRRVVEAREALAHG
jgi:Fic family protein